MLPTATDQNLKNLRAHLKIWRNKSVVRKLIIAPSIAKTQVANNSWRPICGNVQATIPPNVPTLVGRVLIRFGVVCA